MDLLKVLDAFVVEALVHGYSKSQMTTILLDEDCVLTGEGDEGVPLLEAVRRVRIKRGGVNVTLRKTGRPNPARSQKAKMVARKNSSKRRAAARRFARSPKAKQMRRVMSQVRRNKGGSRPKFKRPKVNRPKFKRPKVRRPTFRRPARRPRRR